MSKDSQQPKIISLEFVEYFAGRFGLTLGFSMLTALVASFCFDVYHVSESLAGIAVGAFILAAMVSRLFAGRYLDVVGR